MHLHTLPFSGYYEHDGEIAERLQLVVADSDEEERTIASKILPDAGTVTDDSARREYVFRYELGEHLGDGLYALRIWARDASDDEHGVEIAAGLALPGSAERRIDEGLPMWFISERLHYRELEGSPPRA